jgi:lipoate-protein ligase A
MNSLGFLEEFGWSFDSTFQSQLVHIQLLATSKNGRLLLRRDQGGMAVFWDSRSTTLYAPLAELISSHGNIMSIEDSISFRMRGSTRFR